MRGRKVGVAARGRFQQEAAGIGQRRDLKCALHAAYRQRRGRLRTLLR